MDILQYTLLFIVSLAILIKSAEYFTNTAERIGLHFRISPFIIGVTIIALGTSLPEIATSIISVAQGYSEIVIGNVVGSNIANILLVLGVSAIAGTTITITKNIINVDLPILLASSILLYITTIDGQFSLIDGLISLAGLITYIAYNATSERQIDKKGAKDLKKMKKEEVAKKERESLHIKYPLLLLASGAVLYFSAQYTINSVVMIAEILNVGKEIVAISAIALGTSLPELAVSVTAIKQGKHDIAIGNITGSNIFNAFGVMGISSLIGNLHIPAEIISFTIPSLLLITILYIFVTMEKTISKWEGMIMILLYIALIAKTFGIL